MLMRRRWRRGRHGYGYGCGHHKFRHGGPGRWSREGWGNAYKWGWLDWLASRLDASPEQARVIRNEVDGFMDTTKELRRELRLSRDDIGRAMRGDSFDEEVMGETFGRQDDRIREIREALVAALARIHDVLDERQRRRLAELLETGPGAGPYRGWM